MPVGQVLVKRRRRVRDRDH